MTDDQTVKKNNLTKFGHQNIIADATNVSIKFYSEI